MGDWYKASLAGLTPATEEELIDDLPFTSRRSPVICRHACVATSQPLAGCIGIDFLRRGANAADAAIAIAAAIAVTEPCSTGLGGDMFCLYYDSQTRKVFAINGSGKSPASLTLQCLREHYADGSGGGVDEDKFRHSVHAVTVPGAARGWEDLYQRHGSGKFSFSELLEPAAVLAEEGFPVAPITAYHWQTGLSLISNWCKDGESIPLTVDGKRAPAAGDIIVNPDMARVLRDLGNHGATNGFYQGRTGQAIINAIQKYNGVMTMEDLQVHTSEFPEPISATYRGCRLWQVPPNGQGIAGLIALTGLQQLEERNIISQISPESIGSDETYHAMIEMMRLGFADTRAHVADPQHMKVDTDWLLDKDRIGQRAEKLFDPEKAAIQGAPDVSSCTISFQVVDNEGNAVSFVNSNYTGFGTGLVPEGCGFTLQNRGFGFTLTSDHHPNAVGPSKRPCHTIIPGMLTHIDTNELYATISNMGGNMQPQGHFQLTVDMLAADRDPQEAIDKPRFCIVDGTQDGPVWLEKGIDDGVVNRLRERGHKVKANVMGHKRSVFGRAQIIKRDRKNGVLWAGSDPRSDGCAIGF